MSDYLTTYEVHVTSEIPPDPDLTEEEIFEFAQANGADIIHLSTVTSGPPDPPPATLSGVPLGVGEDGELLEGESDAPVNGERSYWVTVTQQKTYRIGANDRWAAGKAAVDLFDDDHDLHAAVTHVAPA